MPKAGAAPKVKAAENALAKAEKAEAKARTERDRCAGAEASARTSVGDASAGIGRAEATLAQASDAVAGATASLTATKDQLVGWLGEDGDPRSLFEAREAELTAAEQAVESARRAVEAARAGLDEAARLAEGAGSAIATLANRLSGVWGRLEEDRDVPAEPEAVGSAFAAIREELVTRHEHATAERDVAIARGGRRVARARGDPPERGSRARRRLPSRVGRGGRGARRRRRAGDGARRADRVGERAGAEDPRARGASGHREAPGRRPPTVAVPRVPLRGRARRAGGAGERSLLAADGRRLSASPTTTDSTSWT